MIGLGHLLKLMPPTTKQRLLRHPRRPRKAPRGRDIRKAFSKKARPPSTIPRRQSRRPSRRGKNSRNLFRSERSPQRTPKKRKIYGPTWFLFRQTSTPANSRPPTPRGGGQPGAGPRRFSPAHTPEAARRFFPGRRQTPEALNFGGFDFSDMSEQLRPPHHAQPAAGFKRTSSPASLAAKAAPRKTRAPSPGDDLEYPGFACPFGRRSRAPVIPPET